MTTFALDTKKYLNDLFFYDLFIVIVRETVEQLNTKRIFINS